MATPVARIRACRSCRQQKLRCDAQLDPQQRCSRCRRMGMTCVMVSRADGFKKQTKADMQQELDRLKERLSQFNPPVEGGAGRSSNSSSVGVVSPTTFPSAVKDCLMAAPLHIKHSDTVMQSLDGQDFEPKSIDDCFALFFESYASFLPILDPSMSPNLYHTLSPFLFWAICWVGSRKYSGDPKIMRYLASRMVNLALSSLSSRATPIQVIQALLLLCTWPVPVNTESKDITHILSGATMNLAMEIGLHTFGIGQEFARIRLPQDEKEKAFRARLWLYCLIVCQSKSCNEGLPPMVVINYLDHDRENNEVITAIPSDLRLRHEIHSIQTSAMAEMVQCGLTLDAIIETNVLGSLIKLFDAQAMKLTHQSPSPLNMLYIYCVRLHIQSFHFFEPPSRLKIENLIDLYSVTRRVIDTVAVMDQTKPSAIYACPSYIHRAVILAAFSILKLSRSFASPYFDLEGGKKSYFSAIMILKSMSLKYDDLGARGAMILQNLWDSENVFRKADGTVDSMSLRIRSRLSMSIVFDSFWYWREEFGGQPSPFKNDEEAPISDLNNCLVSATSETPPELQPVQSDWGHMDRDTDRFPVLLPDDERFPDFDWAASLDFSGGGWSYPSLGTEFPSQT